MGSLTLQPPIPVSDSITRVHWAIKPLVERALIGDDFGMPPLFQIQPGGQEGNEQVEKRRNHKNHLFCRGKSVKKRRRPKQEVGFRESSLERRKGRREAGDEGETGEREYAGGRTTAKKRLRKTGPEEDKETETGAETKSEGHSQFHMKGSGEDLGPARQALRVEATTAGNGQRDPTPGTSRDCRRG